MKIRRCECGFETRIRKKYRRHRRHCDGRKAEEVNTERQATQKEPTFAKLRQEAKTRQIPGYGKMNKQELIEALKG